MRIIAGEWKGRRLVAPKGRGVRPTLDKVREAIFDVLTLQVDGARVLDLFAGTGAMGIEALSRGAAQVTWVDEEARPIAAIRENLQKLGAPAARCEILNATALAAIRRFARAERQFDIVFVDPPYEGGLYDETMMALAVERIVAPGGLVAVEHGRRIEVSANYGDLLQFKVRRYGETCVAWFRRGAPSAVVPEAGEGEGGPEEDV